MMVDDLLQQNWSTLHSHSIDRLATLVEVVNHYDTCFSLGFTAQEQSDVVEYVKSLRGVGKREF